MKIFAISDVHSCTKAFESASELMYDSDIIIISGDLTKKGTRKEALEVLSHIERHNNNIIAVHGNIDRSEVMDILEEKGYNLHERGRVIKGIGFFGVGGSSPTPINTPTEYSEEKIMEFLKKGYDVVKDTNTTILVTHAPPRWTRDRTFMGLRGGSKSVNKFMRKNPIDLCIAGHIHEADGVENLDFGIVANPGSFKRGKFLTIDIDESISIQRGKIKYNNITIHPHCY
ncbi:MAG: metallophosphoesterase family protein [Spirochaetota bacterium]|nr:metallophosphoesterase family protein [Spirochaetota bacterium]